MAAMVQESGEGVPLTLDATDADKNDTKKRRFLRGLRRMFRRRSAKSEQEVREPSGTPGPTTLRGRSSDQLLTDDDSPKRKRQQSGLSVSHDSVFTAEASGGDSDDERARPRLRPSIAGNVSAELAAAVRRRTRGDTSEEDEDLGLPKSLPDSPPKRGPGRGRIAQSGAEQSSCSEGSLLSAGSSDPEDEFRSSRGDLASVLTNNHSSVSSIPDTSDAEEPPSGLAPLSHSAARHKMAVRPRRTHGPPRRARSSQLSPGTALPTTPEVNEDVTRSTTPETISVGGQNSTETTSTGQQSSNITTNTRHIVTSTHIIVEKTTEILSQSESTNLTEEKLSHVPKETKLKSSSLPSGLALSQLVGQPGLSPAKFSLSTNEELTHTVKVGRSKSNAQKKDSSDTDDSLNEQQFSSSEKNVFTQQMSKQTISTHRNMDMRYINLTGELQKKFGSMTENEELLKSEIVGQESVRKSNEKVEEKERHYENVTLSNNNKDLTKAKVPKDLEDQLEKHSNKKEESFFGRLLLRRSAKKSKKDLPGEKDEYIESKKPDSKEQVFRTLENYNSNNPKHNITDQAVVRPQKMICTEQHVHKSIGQTVFSNQNHKRIDPKGGYVNDVLVNETFNNIQKGSVSEYGVNDMKRFSEREKIVSEMKFSQGKLDDLNGKRLSSENIKSGTGSQPRIRQRIEPLDIPASPELHKKPTALPRTSIESKGFFPIINQGKVYPSKDNVNGSRFIKNSNSSKISNKDDSLHQHLQSPKIKTNSEVFSFGSQNNIQPSTSLDINTKPLSYSVSPPRSVWPQNSNPLPDVKSSSQGSLDKSNRNSRVENDSRYFDYSSRVSRDFELDNSKAKPKIAGLSSYQQKISQIGNQIENESDISYTDSTNSRNPVIKSHSFRLNSDTNTSASHQDMPSLPPMFGISESSIDSWESNYKKNMKESSEAPSSLELGSDSLMNYTYKSNNITTEAIYTDRNLFVISNIEDIHKDHILDESSKIDLYEKENRQISHYTKNVTLGTSKVRDTDISRIEANIDSIIGSPKPLNCATLKSSSLDSVKSFTEKQNDQNRKAVSNESISQNKVYMNQPVIPDMVGSVSFNNKLNTELFASDEQNTNTAEISAQSNIEQSFETHVSVTVLNSDSQNVSSSLKTTESIMSIKQIDNSTNSSDRSSSKILTPQKDKSSEKTPPSSESTVPEFMKIQLNKIDQKPASNIVLSTSVVIDNKSNRSFVKNDKFMENSVDVTSKMEKSVSHDSKKVEKTTFSETQKVEIIEKSLPVDTKELPKPQRKFSSEDVEILEKSDININSNAFNVPLKKNGSQSLLNRSTEILTNDNSQSGVYYKNPMESKLSVPASLNFKKTSVSSLPPLSPTAHKNFLKKKSESPEIDSLKRQSAPIFISEQKSDSTFIDKTYQMNNNQSVKRVSSQELLTEQTSRIDRSSSSSDDAYLESTVVLRKKTLVGSNRNNAKKDDEPELMKVFARRSLKLKDSESDALAQDILNVTSGENKDEKSKFFNVMNRSRDSDKENEADSPKDERKKIHQNSSSEIINDANGNKVNNKNNIDHRKHNPETAELMQAQRVPKKLLDSNPASTNNTTNISTSRHTVCYGLGSYQRSIGTNVQTSNSKVESKSDSLNFKKEVADSTPEKRIRNRTFPDSTNDINKDDTTKNLPTKTEPSQYSIDSSSLPKRLWNQSRNENDHSLGKDVSKGPFRKSSFVSLAETKTQNNSNKISAEKQNTENKESEDKTMNENNSNNDVENGGIESETDGSPQFKGILQMRAEWERRAQQAMTK